jgi:serine/threonine protein kinase
MGEVYLAHDTVLDRHVAVKFIAALQPDAAARERFLVEARAAARLQHPNVVTVYRVGDLDGQPCIVSEFIRDQTLADLPKPVPWQRALEIGVGLARGLAAAHRSGILHRDIKPANVILTEDGTPKLLDFGLAKIGDGEPAVRPVSAAPRPLPPAISASVATIPPRDPAATLPPSGHPLTLEGTIMGTPGYMPPEAWRGEPATPRADVYCAL